MLGSLLLPSPVNDYFISLFWNVWRQLSSLHRVALGVTVRAYRGLGKMCSQNEEEEEEPSTSFGAQRLVLGFMCNCIAAYLHKQRRSTFPSLAINMHLLRLHLPIYSTLLLIQSSSCHQPWLILHLMVYPSLLHWISILCQHHPTRISVPH